MSPTPDRPVRVTAGHGRLGVWASATRAGNDLVVTVGGGERPHVGCVALAQARPSTADPARRSATASLIAVPPHKEGELAMAMAKRLAAALDATVVVSAGIHSDDLSGDEIATVSALADELSALLLSALEAR